MGYTFGWEAEYATPVTSLALELHRRDATIDQHVHGYTCDCSGCEHIHNTDEANDQYDHDPYVFRVKHDSSCGGEVVSRVFDDPTAAKQYWNLLEEAAVLTDAEPGLQAGFHVHVGREHLHAVSRGRLVWAMMLYEPWLLQIASGRFTQHRGWNSPLEETMSSFMQGWLYDNTGVSTYSTMVQREDIKALIDADEALRIIFFRGIGNAHRNVDRHSSMAFSPRFPTMEFRLWNSTRSAWRMELWCRLSLLLADPAFVVHAISMYDTEMTLEDFCEVVYSYRNVSRETSALLKRQYDFIAEVANELSPSYNRTFTTA